MSRLPKLDLSAGVICVGEDGRVGRDANNAEGDEECCQPQNALRWTRTAYSWSSETSPVRAENPRNGTSGNETFFNVKHGVQSSPNGTSIKGPF